MWHLFVVLLWVSLSKCEQYCYTSQPSAFYSWGSKQTYEAVRGSDVESYKYVPDCEVINFWSLHRHGTRFPKPEEAKQMKDILIPLRNKILVNNKSKLCKDDIKALKDWKFDEDLINRANNLTDIGYDESYFTGTRYRKYYLNDVEGFKVRFRSTVDSWTQDSLRAVYDGMVDYDHYSDNNDYVIEGSKKEDKVLAPYDCCDAWKKYQKFEAKVEPDAFLKSDVFVSLINRVAKRLGVKSLTSKSIISMWEICRLYRVAFSDQLSIWCTAFKSKDFQILEYYDDMIQYYFAGYGSDLNAKLGCHALNNLFGSFNDSVENSDEKRANIYVAHLTITEMVMAALGIGKDGLKLNIQNEEKLIKTRNYRTNNLQPYGANFAAVLYKCDDDNYVQMYHNEKILKIQNKQLIKWKEFFEYFKKFRNCDFKYCK